MNNDQDVLLLETLLSKFLGEEINIENEATNYKKLYC